MGRNELEADKSIQLVSASWHTMPLHSTALGKAIRIHDHLDEFGEQVRATAVQIARELGGLGPC